MTENPRQHETIKPIIGKKYEEIMEVYTQHSEKIMNNSNVIGIGIGIQETEETRQYALQVYLENDLNPEQLDDMTKVIDGIPVVYQTVGTIEAR